MKPRILRCGLDFKYPKEIIGHQHDNWPELQTMPVNHKDWSFPDLIECASLNGYKVANTNVLNGAHFLPLNGSVGCHVDEAFYGITIACLAYYDVFCEMPQLVARLGWLDLKQGDVFIFDSTKWHGWISNGECLLALINVRKTRKRTAHPQGNSSLSHPSPPVSPAQLKLQSNPAPWPTQCPAHSKLFL